LLAKPEFLPALTAPFFTVEKMELFGFHRKLGLKPFVPAPLEYIDLSETTCDKLPCHPGTGFLVGSGSV